MARRIYKYPLRPAAARLGLQDEREFEITMPRDARVLHFGADGTGQLCVWVLVHLPGIDGAKRIGVYFTGEDLHYFNAVYVGTHVVGAFVYHCFDLGWKGESVAL